MSIKTKIKKTEEVPAKIKIKPSGNAPILESIEQDTLKLLSSKIQSVDNSITFDKELVKKWQNEGKIDSDVSLFLFKSLDSVNQLLKFSSQINLIEPLNLLPFSNDDVILNDNSLPLFLIKDKFANPAPFFRDIDNNKEFGITKAVLDFLTKALINLNKDDLGNKDKSNPCLYFSEVSSNNYIIRHYYSNPPSENYRVREYLEYSYTARDYEEAVLKGKEYIECIKTSGLKALMAFWAQANKVRSFLFSVKITDLMEHLSGEDRSSYYSTKEKNNFWKIIEYLENTVLALVVKSKTVIEVKHKLIEIKLKEFSQNVDEHPVITTVPLKMVIKVLNAERFNELATQAYAISKGVFKTHSQHVLLALSIETRNGQCQNKGSLNSDIEYLMKRANLSQTYKKNPRIAEKRFIRTLEELVINDIIDGYQITKKERVEVFYKEKKKYTKKKLK
jgi:hypothetical protein